MSILSDIDKFDSNERIEIACTLLLNKLDRHRHFRRLRLESMADVLAAVGFTDDEIMTAIDCVNRMVPLGIPK